MKNDRRREKSLFNPAYVPMERRRRNIGTCIFFLSLAGFLFCQHYLVSGAVIREQSMLPTLPEGGYFIVNRYVYRFKAPQRGDIVALWPRPYDTEQYVKRIVGLENEEIRISEGKVYIDGRELPEPYSIGKSYPDLGPLKIRENYYFVMGDNREESVDSRHFGPVPQRNILGKIRAKGGFSFR